MNTIDGIIEDLELEESYVGGCTTKGEIIACLENLKILQKEKETVLKALEDVREKVDLRMKVFENVVEESTYAPTRDTYMDKANVCHEIIKIIDRKIAEVTKNE